MPDNGYKQIIEALIFASDFPISVKKICQIIDDASEDEIMELINDLISEYEKIERGIILKASAGGYEFVTRPEQAVWVRKLHDDRKRNKLSHAGLETVALIAYRQPITRVDIENVRGVDSGGTLRTLLERKLIIIAGREKSPGRPLIYKTSDSFLRYFGVNSLDDLPRIEEIGELVKHGEEEENIPVEQLSISGGDSSEKKM